MPERLILVPLDGSELAENALDYAALIPSERIRLLMVEPVNLTAARRRWEHRQSAPGGDTWRVTSPAEYLNLLAAPLRQQGREVETVVTTGEPESQIVAAAEDAGLIVMATRGQGAARTLLGSVAAGVARRSGVPTLLIRDTRPAAAPAVLRVVVPVDGSARSDAVLPIAAALGQALRAPLHLLRVVEPATALAPAAELVREAATDLARQRAQLGTVAETATTEVREGPVVRQLLDALRPGDLVVMATRGRGPVRRLVLGSVASALVEQAPVPVILLNAGHGAGTPAPAGREEGHD